MLTAWQQPIFEHIARKLPFIREQPLSTYTFACLLGDACYIFNGKTGSLFDLGLGAIHPGWMLTLGGIAALFGNLVLLAASDKVDSSTAEHGLITRALRFCHQAARLLTLNWRPRNPFILGFAALAFNGVALFLDAFWEILVFGFTPVAFLQGVNGLIIFIGLGAAMASRIVPRQEERGRLNAFAPKLLFYATFISLFLGLLALAPFLLLNGLLFTLGNAAQHQYALRMQVLDREAAITATI